MNCCLQHHNEYVSYLTLELTLKLDKQFKIIYYILLYLFNLFNIK